MNTHDHKLTNSPPHQFANSPVRQLTVLITGAANGLGRATALELARKGWNVIATDIDRQGLDLFHGENGITMNIMDVTSDGSVENVFNEVSQAVESIDLIINNAGKDCYFPLSEAPTDEIRKIFEINFFGAYRVNHTFLPMVKTPGGRIIHIGSETYHLTLPFMPYPLTKSALEAYAKVLRQELRLIGIDVIVIRPGAIQTQFVKNLSNIQYPAFAKASAGKSRLTIPLRSAFHKFTSSLHAEVGKVVSPEKAAEFIYRVSQIPHPRAVYRINNSLKLRLAARTPFRIMEKVMQKKLR